MSYRRWRSPAYKPAQTEPYKVSRSKIDLFMQCPRCFWLDVRLKIKRPSSPPFQINKAIDELFKKEFDAYRQKGKPHPMMVEYKVDAVPYAHDDINKWRENFTGVVAIHKPTNLHIFGAIDDIWVNANKELMVVDYKATAKAADVSLDADWQIMYKRQMEIYQWLLRANGFSVSDTGYFVYANGRLDLDGFNDRVEFRTKIIPYKGSDKWVEPAIRQMKQCMDGDMPPVGKQVMDPTKPCEFCTYAKSRTELTLKALQSKK